MYTTWKAVHGALTALTEAEAVEDAPVVQNDPPPEPEFDFSSLDDPPPSEDQLVVLSNDPDDPV
ncbi:MAG: hypothetical protein F4X84_06800 [Synechococcus sp. SB0662_bin_45]|nr:hypothetical protein [Synechococcus sp. SB0668_bin_13]MYE22047.1 hypothetical protein [Synechococcus sp. SB0662_bin_45]MYG63971.1 hypothetical protein [Synechococcus sp. SB0675_bin_7]MYK85680.1 hypothetical protein [Synechococcus sp. SB0669_bin_7]